VTAMSKKGRQFLRRRS